MQLDLEFQAAERTGKLKKEQQEVAQKIAGAFHNEYQLWYSEALAIIKQLIPERLSEFTHLYHGDGKRKQCDANTYHIQDWLNGVRAAINVFGRQEALRRLGDNYQSLRDTAENT